MIEDLLPAHGGQLRELALQFGVPEETLIDFSASIRPAPLSDAIVAALCDALRARRIISTYPEMRYTALRQAIGAYLQVGEESIVVGSGVMPLLGAAIHVLGAPRVLVPVPSFAEYGKVLRAGGAERCTLTLIPEENFSLAVARVLDGLKASGAQALLLANPQSPSGRLMKAASLLELCEQVRALGASVLVDEAFIDYTPAESLARWAAQRPGLIVLRSLTKFFAIPGLRVAYAVACPETRAAMEEAIPAWPVGSLAAEAARMALCEDGEMAAARATNAQQRNWLAERLRSLGLRVFPGEANYLLVKIADRSNGLEFWRKMIAEHRIVLRCCANFEGLDEHYFRIGVRTRAENRRLVEAFAALLQTLSPASSAPM
ncbi:MAG: pyridoxal phosphate-dependent aminotransferase [Terracidiphilus sp.]